ncbi:hypothetical protein CAP40_16740 [Sphingomonas sp. IBVSS2]|nr:hypothetical protein CAP40_16740 [Sphingomonas sp. IBVSS2]
MADSPQVHGSSILQGAPWDEAVKMLARMKVDARHLAEEMESQIRLAIVCKREDLVFSDIMIKLADGQFVNMSEGSPKRLIVQEYLKQSLVSADLPSADMMSPFAVIWLGEAISEPRSDNG